MGNSIWLFIACYAAAAAIPGPAQGVMVAEVLARGGAGAAPFVVGMIVGNAIWLSASLLALDTIAAQLSAAVVVIKWVGASLCAYIAWNIWHAVPSSLAPPRLGRRGGELVGGLALTLGNPKAFVFFGAILPQAFDVESLSLMKCVVVVSIGVGIDAAVQSAYLVMASKARQLFQTPARVTLFNRCAAVVIGSAAALIVLGA